MDFFNESRLRECLALYGSDVEAWPDPLRAMGRWAARHHPEFAALIEAEKRFEHLLSGRALLSPHTGLAERIIAASAVLPSSPQTLLARLSDTLGNLKPASLAAMLVLGLAIGFGTFMTVQPENNLMVVAYADDEGSLP